MVDKNNSFIYDDNYETCYETYSTLRIYTNSEPPSNITKIIGIKPTELTIIGTGRKKNNVNGWFLSSENFVVSKDSRKHIDWILNQIYPLKDKILEFIYKGYRIDISCYWSSMHGTGGPTLPPYQMKKLSDLNIEIWFDFYS